MAALFIAQMIGMDLSMHQQVMVVLTSVIASVGAASIPEAGPADDHGLHSRRPPRPVYSRPTTVDWFLDRCRTAIVAKAT